ncbi:MAG TPA: redoxin domain-containing protein [Hypericibacter adhaerens]|jgi:peroxiredoxin/predicted 2-oxoglutarate/Fe(II)-dependent dioxygenase YbiX|uniref:Fe2OG dioxygenase domain-containing protein n=1 Tax=Hypericibacter adhaerens TaxID=2602016 RepID=A0A5J6N081_9PROT|nr:redoxin domain-containing protein [Hypericibacter adhaerens]QEX23392.1 hypothetical protein FRZ61_33300 [Hypericibacter adhaerens]HWA45444.1 redoxin domain-containing protein [Hypericibacter adhaerens]HWA81068.1 redoxin domain-containing protein [Acetobacteraceae bacterium]
MEDATRSSGRAPASRPGLLPFEAGDPAPAISALDQAGEPAFSNADQITGRPLLLLFCPAGGEAALLAGFRDHAAEFAALETIIFAISRQAVAANQAWHAALHLPFTLLSDSGGGIFRTYGATEAPLVIILDPDHRVARVLRADVTAPADPAPLAAAALACLRASFPPRGLRVSMQAPVLLLPRVLEEEHCARLIELFHKPVASWQSDGFRSEGHDRERGDFKVEHAGSYGQLTEYVVRDPAVQAFLDQCFNRRVSREMRKVFQTKVSQREDYRIARYDSATGGVLRPHRDNATKETSHRRFTMTINLNAGEYEGGALRFREYADHYYEVERGTAVIWSALLLHEVMPVTRGARFILGVHMYGT